jgi:hypothetical protein
MGLTALRDGGNDMDRKSSPEPLSIFSDGVFAIIIRVLVLDLRAPGSPSFAALLPLWPTALSYAVSYLFLAIVWINHHGDRSPRDNVPVEIRRMMRMKVPWTWAAPECCR